MDTAARKSETNDHDWALLRDFICALKTACDDLHVEPFNPQARDTVLRLLQIDSIAADSALERVVEARKGAGTGQLLSGQ